MLLRPNRREVMLVVKTVGSSLTALAAGTAVLAMVALLAGDVDTTSALLIGASIAVVAGQLARIWATDSHPLTWTTGVVAATLSWTACTLVGALPLYLSGHYPTYVDAAFDAMSGLTTTGLTMVQDIDHMEPVMVLYRHGLEAAGGLAAVVIGLTLLTAATATSASLRPGDARDERIMPNIERQLRLVIQIGSIVIGVGFVATSVGVFVAGVRGSRVLLHGASLAISAATTGGFSLTSQSVGYYHSLTVELILIPLMLAGAISFLLHRAAWRGDWRRLTTEIEVRTLVLSILSISFLVMVGLARSGALTGAMPLLRKGLFTTIAAHTTTGLHTVAPRLLATDWGLMAPAGLVAAMTIGGMTGSTAGGLKTLRVALIGKGVSEDVRRVLLPESALVVSNFTWGRRRILKHGHVRSSATMLLISLSAALAMSTTVLFLDATVDLTEALFLSTSAISNSGQVIGTLTPADPVALKIGYASLMLLGRLEWIAVFATLGFLYAAKRGTA